MNIEETPSFSSERLEYENMRQSNTSDISAATSGQRRGGHGGSISSDSGSDLYSEGESEDSDHSERPGNTALSVFQHSLQRPGAHGNKTALRSPRSPFQAIQSEKQGGSDDNRLGAKRITCSLASIPVSYFSSSNVKSFSIGNEIGYKARRLRHFYKMIKDDRLPWMTDFADIHKMELPRKAKEIAWRLNLNIPYYSSNYIEIFYVVTMPLLFVYNTPFFVVTFLAIVIIHSIRMHKKKTHEYGDSIVMLGRRIRYRKLGHLLVFAMVMLLMFFDGLRTLMWVLLLNVCIIVPHALLRKPTYFDDEDLEKCRPKMVQYAICLVILVLAYLEGDLCADEAAESRRAVERERKRVAQAMAKHEAKD